MEHSGLCIARAAAMAGLLAALPLLQGRPAVAADAVKTARTVSVNATGWVTAEPDTALVSAGVTTEADTVGAAVIRNNAVMEKLIDGLKGAGIPVRDLQTAELSVAPRYTQPKVGQVSTINGYRASNRLNVTIRDMNRLGEMLDKAVSLGANDIGGISFEIADTETLTDTARAQAMENARRRAELYAKAAGVQLGEVLSITELGQRSPSGRRRHSGHRRAVPIVVGTRSIEVQVQVVYALR